MSGPIDMLCGYLDENGVEYEVVEHPERFTAASEARASGVSPENAVKDVVLKSGGTYIVAVIPASERLDLQKVRVLLKTDERPSLASETEIAARFPEYEVGALPPFAPIHQLPEIVDRRLLDHSRVLCSGGDHRHSLRVDPSDIVRLGDATVADLCQE